LIRRETRKSNHVKVEHDMPRLTLADLVSAAAASDPEIRKQGYAAFQTWLKAAPKLKPQERLTAVERNMLAKLYAAKGFGQHTQARGRL
jgi:hypothetical protein